MRSRLALAVLAAGCASTRVVTSPPAVPVKTVATAVVRPPTPPVSELRRVANRRIDAWERRLRVQPSRRRAMRESLTRGAPYLPRTCAILAEHGLPADLALLPVVESEFWPTARGHGDERGLWQLRRATARRFGLVVDGRRDDRLDPERATRGAARYLFFLYARYGDWPLALAAYNAGERRVDRALVRGRNGDFWELAERQLLPRISREYVPHFLAVVRVTNSALACGESRPVSERLASLSGR